MRKFINQYNNYKNFLSLHQDFNIPILGVIHIGAHHGDEILEYNKLNYKNIIFVEPVKKTFEYMVSNVNRLNQDPECQIHFINKAFGNSEREVDMYIETANQGQSSSILEPALHKIKYPGITFPFKETVQMTTLNKEIKKIPGKFNMLNIDVQGYELEVLKGSTEILPEIDFINTEVNKAELYKNCAMIEQIDEFLSSFDFTKIDENWMGEVWGDAIYVKKKFIQ